MTPKFQDHEHQLKIDPVYFNRVLQNEKTAEIRKNDRDFQTGDFISLNEYDREEEKYSGNQIDIQITHIVHGGQFGIEKGFCLLSFKKL